MADQSVVAVPIRAQGDVWLAVNLDARDVQSLKDAGVDVKHPQQKHLQPTREGKHGFAFLAPVFAGLPGAAVLVGAATLGIVGGAAGAIGGKVGNWIWPDKKEDEAKPAEPPA